MIVFSKICRFFIVDPLHEKITHWWLKSELHPSSSICRQIKKKSPDGGLSNAHCAPLPYMEINTEMGGDMVLSVAEWVVLDKGKCQEKILN